MGCWRTGSQLERSTNSNFGYIYQRYSKNKEKVRVATERTWLLGICSISGLRYQLKFTHNYSLLSASKDFNQHAKLCKSVKDRDWAIAVFLLTQIFCILPWPNAYFSVLPFLFRSLLFFNLHPPSWIPQHASTVSLLPVTTIKITLETGDLKGRSCSLI